MARSQPAAVQHRPRNLVPILLLLSVLGLATLITTATASAPPSRMRLTASPVASAPQLFAVHTVCLDGPPVCDYDSVQSAVDAAGEGDLIKVAEGHYTDLHARPAPSGFLGPAVITQAVYLSQTLSIRGGYAVSDGFADPPDPAAHPTILDAHGQGRVLFLTGAVTPAVEGLQITGGDASGLGGDPFAKASGGGIYVASASAIISNCWIYDNTAHGGGGVFIDRSPARLVRNQIHDNTGGLHGGGAYLWFSPATLQENVISANTAITWGGGLSLVGSNARLEANQVVSNTGGYGGGIVTDSCDPTLIANDVSHNDAIAGGGLYLSYAGWISDTRVLSNTVSDNTASLAGGVLLLYAPNEFRGNVVSGNSADDGGGVWMFSSDTQFVNNEFVGNVATELGGGLRLDTSTATRLTGNTIARNQAAGGGGLYLLDTPATLSGNRFERNVAGQGGGLSLDGSDARLESNTIVHNTATGDGGGLLVLVSHPVLTNSVVAANQAGGAGAGLFLGGSAARLLHTTLAENEGGSGIELADYESLPSTALLINTILVSHTAGIAVATGSTAQLEATLWGNGLDWAGEGAILTGTRNLWGPPAFRSPAKADYHLRRESAAVDAGIDAGVTRDLDGDLRPLGPAPDLGADEFSAGLRLSKTAWPDPVVSGAPLTYTLVVSNTGYVVLHGTIVDHLPPGVTPSGTLTWTAAIAPGEAWTLTLPVTVAPAATSLLTNTLHVSTLEGADASQTCTTAVVPPQRRLYLPLILRAP